MCGIVGYIGDKQADDILLTGLKRLEYRGYDSAGLAILNGSDLQVEKKEGKVDDLRSELNGQLMGGTLGVGHTRWATHGPPSDANAHPHVSSDGSFALVHNGIIENHSSIKKQLQEKGYTFDSETDTEVLVHLIEEVKRETNLSLPHRFRQ
jgi:glucosamine--fructose-6-phosphate aminotransferase (isomerizing)